MHNDTPLESYDACLYKNTRIAPSVKITAGQKYDYTLTGDVEFALFFMARY